MERKESEPLDPKAKCAKELMKKKRGWNPRRWNLMSMPGLGQIS